MVPRRVTSQFSPSEQIAPPLLTRLTPPAQPARLLSRPRIDNVLAAALDYPLTIVHAAAGSGKTVALAGLAVHGGWPTAWCRMDAADDQLTLVRHLLAAFATPELTRPTLDQQRVLGALTSESASAALELLVNELAAALTDETLLVLDDYQVIDQQPALRELIERLLTIQPPRLHILLATRYAPQLARLYTARARGELLVLRPADLAFDADETRALFALYQRTPPTDPLLNDCRGWPLALHMLAVTPAAETLDALTPLLDPYLRQTVLDEQPPALQTFLLRTASFRWLDPDAFATLPGLADGAVQQAELERRDLFLDTDASGHLRYQPLWSAFLHREAARRLDNRRALALAAADYYRAQGDTEGVLHHLLAAGEQAALLDELERVAEAWLAQGRAALLLRWLDQVPASIERPALLLAQASANRQRGHFTEALAQYQTVASTFEQAGDPLGQARALRGQAQVYLDTVQPTPAVGLLQRALKLLPKTQHAERIELLQLQAENWTNSGRADVALRLMRTAQQIAQRGDAALDNSALPPRVLLRSGRLLEAQHQLEAALPGQPERGLAEPLNAHRAPPLLLALLDTLLGNGLRALAMARHGLLEAQSSGARLTEAIAHMRLGHAYQAIAPLDRAAAQRHYQQALALAETVGVARTRAEVYLGLTLLHGHDGDLGAAEQTAQHGIQLAAAAGDQWTAALLWLALGGAGVAAGERRAAEWLSQAERRFVRGGDSYGQAVVALWRAIGAIQAGDDTTTQRSVAELLALTAQHQYSGLLTAPTLFGPRDLLALVPVLLRGQAQPVHVALAHRLLRQGFPTIAADTTVSDYHPGFTLRIQLLGSFHIWRGSQEILDRDWSREKARQMFQLLLTFRGRWLQREQICAWLWPDAPTDAAERQFKVTLNALNSALEPLRPPRTAPFFIRRQGLAYSFAPSSGCWIDVDEFELRLASGAWPGSDPAQALRSAAIAVQLYRGDYLPEALYDSWTLDERERLLARYLAAATALARELVASDPARAIELCEQVLRRDRCYEEAYQVLMLAHIHSGSRSQALRSYDRCQRALRADLDIEPLPETTRLYERMKRNQQL